MRFLSLDLYILHILKRYISNIIHHHHRHHHFNILKTSISSTLIAAIGTDLARVRIIVLATNKKRDMNVFSFYYILKLTKIDLFQLITAPLYYLINLSIIKPN